MSKHNLEFLSREDLSSFHNALEMSLKILSEHYQKSVSNEDIDIRPIHDTVTILRELKFESFNEIDRRNGYPCLRAKQSEAYEGSF